MAYYDVKPYYDTLTFGDIFSSSTEFISKVVSIGDERFDCRRL